MELRNRFKSFFHGQGVKLSWSELDKVYSSKSRHYLNWNHVANCLRRVDSLQLSSEQKNLFEKIFWVQNFASVNDLDTNLRFLKKIYKNDDSLPIIVSLMEGQRNELGKVFSDINMGFVCQGSEYIFRSFEEQIRDLVEVGEVPLNCVRTLIKVYSSKLKKKFIFSSKMFREKYEVSTRKNLEKAIDLLTKVRDYKPEPTNTSEIDIPENLTGLLESLAENIHDSWSELRISQGWQYGPNRDDELKTHSCLIPYDMLTEGEREFDRRTSQETIKLILSKGYKIISDEEEKQVQYLLEAEIEALSTKELLVKQKELKGKENVHPLSFYLLGKAFQGISEKVLAYECFQEGLRLISKKEDPNLYRDIAFEAARSLADCFAFSEADRLLNELIENGFEDGDITGQQAKIRKTMALKYGLVSNLPKALAYYSDGYEKAMQGKVDVDSAIYNGINTATMYLLSGESVKCHEIAENVRALCLSKEKRNQWDYASIGEAALLEGDFESSVHFYTKAAELASFGEQHSMRSQALAISNYLNQPTEWLRSVFYTQPAVLFCGHRIDIDNEVRFPASDEDRIREEIKTFILENNPGFGYCSADAGSDIIFIEEMLRHGAEVHIYLPFEEKFFMQRYERFPESWKKRFEKIKSKVTSITETGSYDQGLNDVNYQFNNKYMAGYAKLKAESSGCDLKALTVWDGVLNERQGGVDAAVKIWENADIEIQIIKPKGKGTISQSAVETFKDFKAREHLFMMFADVKGYSKLAGHQLVLFTKYFMGKSDEIVSKYEDKVVVRRSQGDGLFLAFSCLKSAVAVSREIRKMLLETDWQKENLPDLTARFALDAGPCYSYKDPISKNTDLSGTHVIRAARLEPVTPPGYIYASESFAALATLQNFEENFELAGQVKLPKSYGEMRVYHLG